MSNFWVAPSMPQPSDNAIALKRRGPNAPEVGHLGCETLSPTLSPTHFDTNHAQPLKPIKLASKLASKFKSQNV
jgi:hypothetical protein